MKMNRPRRTQLTEFQDQQVWIRDLLGTTEIAERFNLSGPAATVSNWAARYDHFPLPLVYIADTPVYYYPEIYSWVKKYRTHLLT
jgi:hypothetical protein